MIHRHPDFQGMNPKNKTALHVAVGTGSLVTTKLLPTETSDQHRRDRKAMSLNGLCLCGRTVRGESSID